MNSNQIDSVLGGIPLTTPHRYLSGMAALNLPSKKGTGDWHMIETFFRPKQSRSRLFVVGENCEYETTSLLGDTGVFECSEILDQYHIAHPQGDVFAASHARAIADMVLVSAQNGETLDHVLLDDWMPRDEDKAEVFSLLELAYSKLDFTARGRIDAWKRSS